MGCSAAGTHDQQQQKLLEPAGDSISTELTMGFPTGARTMLGAVWGRLRLQSRHSRGRDAIRFIRAIDKQLLPSSCPPWAKPSSKPTGKGALQCSWWVSPQHTQQRRNLRSSEGKQAKGWPRSPEILSPH